MPQGRRWPWPTGSARPGRWRVATPAWPPGARGGRSACARRLGRWRVGVPGTCEARMGRRAGGDRGARARPAPADDAWRRPQRPHDPL